MKPYYTNKQHMAVKLIFNPSSGVESESNVQLMDVISEMQAWKLIPEVYLVQPDCDLPGAILDATAQGIRMVVVCGGDGTVSAVARAMTDIDATLGIIPTGTQNNIAFSLGIPTDIPAAIAVLRKGQRIKIDVGIATCGKVNTLFLEICSVGLFSTLFPTGDAIQHGNLEQVGDFLATLTSSSPADIHLLIDARKEVRKPGHVVLITNMPYAIRHYQFGSPSSFKDGLLDVMFFANLSKIDLLGYAITGPDIDKHEDPRIQHFHVSSIDIETTPSMSVMADGIVLGDGPVHIEVRQHALPVMVSKPTPISFERSGEILEE